MPTEDILTIEDLTLSFGEDKKDVINHISLNIKRGEVLALVGPSGSGKTLLSKTILGLQPNNAKIKSGAIYFNNEQERLNLLLCDKSEWTAFRRKNVSMVFQNPGSSLNPSLKIKDQLATISNLGLARDKLEYKNYISGLLAEIGFKDIERILNAFPHQLSGGQLQRIIIVMTLIKAPKLWIADEPTTALDAVLRGALIQTIVATHRRLGSTLIYISHDLSLVEQIADRIAFIQNGQLVEIGEKHQILSNPHSTIGKTLVRLYKENERESAEFLEDEKKEALIQFKNVTKKFVQSSFLGFGQKRNVLAVKNASFEIRRGEMLGLIGTSGSGKSTIGSLILGLHKPSSGEIFFNEKLLSSAKNSSGLREIARTIQGVFQNPIMSLTPNLTVKQVLSEAIQLYNPSTTKELLQDDLNKLLKALDLDEQLLSRYPHQLSGGQCQRVCIARALAMNPKLLICDEITSSLDVLSQEKILNFLYNLRKSFNLAILYISHDLKLVHKFCDRVIKIEDGNVKV